MLEHFGLYVEEEKRIMGKTLNELRVEGVIQNKNNNLISDRSYAMIPN